MVPPEMNFFSPHQFYTCPPIPTSKFTVPPKYLAAAVGCNMRKKSRPTSYLFNIAKNLVLRKK